MTKTKLSDRCGRCDSLAEKKLIPGADVFIETLKRKELKIPRRDQQFNIHTG